MCTFEAKRALMTLRKRRGVEEATFLLKEQEHKNHGSQSNLSMRAELKVRRRSP